MKHKIPFFSKQDLDKYASYFGKDYNSKDKIDVKIGSEIKEKFFEKTRYWLSLIDTEDYKKDFKSQWLQRQRFSNYTWARIYKKKDLDKHIFFTIGVSFKEKAFIIKLDCQNKHDDPNKRLSDKELRLFNQYLSLNSIDWLYIYSDEWKDYNWDKLVELTNQYIKKYSHAYEEVIAFTFGNIKPKINIKYQFVIEEKNKIVKPQKDYSSLTGSKTDWTKLNNTRIALGDAGELFILEVEKMELIKIGRKDLADNVLHVAKDIGDGLGYDIQSFDKDGNEIYIEVKATSGNLHTPFFLTKTELKVSKIKKNYFIYRLFDFDFLENSGKIQKLDKKNITELVLEPEVYRTSF